MTRTQTIERHQRICTLRRDGLTLRVIAERVGLSLKQVQHVLTLLVVGMLLSYVMGKG